jgi:hypothetical protein
MILAIWHHVYWIGFLVVAFSISQVRAYHVANYTAEHWGVEEWFSVVLAVLLWPFVIGLGVAIGLLWLSFTPGYLLGGWVRKRRQAAKAKQP